MSARIAKGGIWHETNTFAMRPTELEHFESYQYALGAEVLERDAPTGTALVMTCTAPRTGASLAQADLAVI